MNSERIIRLLEGQLRFAKEQNAQLSEQNLRQSEQIDRLSGQVEALTASIRSLEEALLAKEGSLGKARNVNRALGKLITKKSEKVILPPSDDSPGDASPKTSSFKARGNNNAKRKEHFGLEVQEHDIYPSVPDFQPELGRLLKTVDSVRYEYIPPRFIKHVHHLHYYSYQDTVICGTPPAAPLLNSSYDASFIAGILQLRYIYSMPVERIVKYFSENGFEINKPTAHGLIKKVADRLDDLEEILREAIHEDTYIHMDESHYTVLEPGIKSTTGKSSCKVYFWAALANRLKLVHFFYQDGSRARKVLTGYLKKDYHGAVQTDGFSDYKILETEEYPNTIRLACFQHCKRYFLDIEGNEDAKEVVGIINELYHNEHLIPPEYSPEQVLEYRQEYAPPILKKLKEKLLAIQAKKSTLPKSAIGKAVQYALNEYDALSNYVLEPEYKLDNNDIERLNRYISISRKNSMFCGSHQGAKRAALIYSLACSCRMNGINTFDYFKELITRCVDINPNTDKKVLRNLLPDKWKI